MFPTRARRRFTYAVVTVVCIALVTFAIITLPAFAETSDFVNTLIKGLIDIIASIFRTLSKTIFGLMLSLFEMSMNTSIYLFAEIVDQDSIKTLWKLLRDLVNIAITAFFLLTAALGALPSLTQKEISIGAKNSTFTLVALIIAALLVNFSGYFVIFLIDVSNVLTAAISSSLDLTARFASENAVFNATVEAEIIKQDSTAGAFIALIAYHIIAFFLEIFIAYSFLYLALFFIIRFVISIVLVITSPAAVIAFALSEFKLGGFGEYITIMKNRWQSALRYVCVQPILLVIGLFIVVRVFSALEGTLASRADSAVVIILMVIISMSALLYGIRAVVNLFASNASGFGFRGTNQPIRGLARMGMRAAKMAPNLYKNMRGRLTRAKGFATDSISNIKNIRNMKEDWRNIPKKTAMRAYKTATHLGKRAVEGIAAEIEEPGQSAASRFAGKVSAGVSEAVRYIPGAKTVVGMVGGSDATSAVESLLERSSVINKLERFLETSTKLLEGDAGEAMKEKEKERVQHAMADARKKIDELRQVSGKEAIAVTNELKQKAKEFEKEVKKMESLEETMRNIPVFMNDDSLKELVGSKLLKLFEGALNKKDTVQAVKLFTQNILPRIQTGIETKKEAAQRLTNEMVESYMQKMVEKLTDDRATVEGETTENAQDEKAKKEKLKQIDTQLEQLEEMKKTFAGSLGPLASKEQKAEAAQAFTNLLGMFPESSDEHKALKQRMQDMHQITLSLDTLTGKGVPLETISNDLAFVGNLETMLRTTSPAQQAHLMNIHQTLLSVPETVQAPKGDAKADAAFLKTVLGSTQFQNQINNLAKGNMEPLTGIIASVNPNNKSLITIKSHLDLAETAGTPRETSTELDKVHQLINQALPGALGQTRSAIKEYLEKSEVSDENKTFLQETLKNLEGKSTVEDIISSDNVDTIKMLNTLGKLGTSPENTKNLVEKMKKIKENKEGKSKGNQ